MGRHDSFTAAPVVAHRYINSVRISRGLT